MRILYAKHEHICHHCKAIIPRGDIFVLVSFKSRQGNPMFLLIHAECYSKWNESVFNKQLLIWKEKQIPPKKLGRPRKTNNPREHRRLRSILYYYTHQPTSIGNELKIKDLQERMEKLENEI